MTNACFFTLLSCQDVEMELLSNFGKWFPISVNYSLGKGLSLVLKLKVKMEKKFLSICVMLKKRGFANVTDGDREARREKFCDM